jgi:predicted MFS family arabinose efflux permease
VPLLWGGSFAFYFSFYLLLSALPLYAGALGVPERLIGLVIGCFAFVSMLVKPWAGWGADRFGRRVLMLAGALLFVCASLSYTASGSVLALLGVRCIHGVGMGLYPTAAAAAAADLAPPERRGEVLGLLGAAANVAMALGPVVGSAIARHWGFVPLFAASAAVAIGALVTAAFTRETLGHAAAPAFRLGTMLSRRVLGPSAIVLLLMLSYGVQVSFLPIYADRQGVNPGVFFLAFALVVAVVRHWAGRVSDWLGRPPVAAAGLVMAAAALVALAVRQDVWGLTIGGALYGLGFGTAQPALMAWCVDLVDARDRGRAMGTYYTALELGIALGAVASGLSVSAIGFTATFLGTATAAMLAAGLARFVRAPRAL